MTETLNTILAATGRSHYAPSAEFPDVYVSEKPGYEKQPLVVWGGDPHHQLPDPALLWAEEQQLRSAHIRPEDGRIEVREYQAPRIYQIPAHDRLLYGAARGGEDSSWEHGGWWKGVTFSAYTEGPPSLAQRVEWTGEDYPRVAGLVINRQVLVVRGSSAERLEAGWVYPPYARQNGHVYAHPYQGLILPGRIL